MLSRLFPTYARLIGPRHQQGYILLLTLITVISLFISLGGILQLSMINYSSVKRTITDLNGLYVAEAGADKAIFEINQNNAYTGTNTVCPIGATGSNPVTLYSDNIKGRATYESCITNGTIANEKIVYSVGKVYVPATATNPTSVRKVKAVLQGTQSQGYAVQTGPAGLIMSNSATITTGPVYVGGYLQMSNTATIGSAGSPVAVSVANARCPSPATAAYPQLCASGVQPNPITITNSARIYGSVTANGQTNTAGMSTPGLVGSTGVAAPARPDYDRDAQKAAATNTLTSSAASCSGSATKTWPANVHITGNVTLSNNCTILVSGNAWIDGNLNFSNNSVIRPGPSVTVTPTVMVDGSSGITTSNQSVIATNTNNIGFYFITYWSNSACTPNCATVTGTNLYNSQNQNTIQVGNQGLAAGSTFYARWSGLNLSNGGSVGAIMAQRITLSNSGNVTIGSSTSGTGVYSWDVRYYEQL